MVKEKKKNTLEELIDSGNHAAIIELAAQHRSKKHTFTFSEPLKKLSEDDLVKLMKQLLKLLMEYAQRNLDQNVVMDWTKITPEECKSTGQFIQASTDIGIACIQSELTSKCLVELVQIAVFLHGIMLPMPNNMDYVKNFIALYCEKLFLTGLVENPESILNNVVLFLARKSLVKKAATSLKRLYSLRKIFGTIMQEDKPRAAELWSLFKECALSANYLGISEGQKILGLIMALNEVKLVEIHDKIKVYVPGCKIKKAVAYGQIYFEAWCYTVKHDNKTIRDILELNCLQSFIIMGIQKTENILPAIRKILHPFFIHKKQPEVSKMLYNLVQPLIWLYLKNPNGWYRAAAAQLFFDVFPLEDPDMRVVKNDQEVTEQLIMIQELLKDDFPIVRMTAVLGVCVSMSVNWEVFPEEMVKTIFRIIVNDLSRDSSYPEVRVAVVKGLRCLLENPLTVRCLVNVLPKLTGLFHDVAEEVRLAFCQLLLKVKTIFTIKYYDVVPPEHLFARMEEDCRPVQKTLSHLLHNSYFPRNQDLKVWLGRALEIIKVERIASRVFFSYATYFLGFEQSVKFMIQGIRAVHYYIKTKSSSCRMDMEFCDKENIQSFTDYLNSLEAAVGFSNLEVVAGLMEAIIVMWISLKPDATNTQVDNKTLMKMLVRKVNLPLQELSVYYKDTIAWDPVFYVSSFVPALLMPNLTSLCFVKLKNLPSDAEEGDYLTLLECIVNHSQGVDLLNTLKDWLETGLSDSYVPPPAKKRRGRKKNSEIIQQDPTKAYLANRILNTILVCRNLQKRVILEKEPLQEILNLTDLIKCKISKANPQLMSEEEADFLYLLFFNLIRYASHMHGVDTSIPTTSIPLIDDLLEWASKTLMKHMTSIDGDPNHFTLLVFRMCEKLATVSSDLALLGYVDADSCSNLEFNLSLLHTDFGHEFLYIVTRFFLKHAATSQSKIMEGDDTTMLQNNLRYLNKMIVALNNETLLEKVSDKVLGEITTTLGNIMPIIYIHIDSFVVVSEIFNYILKNILKYAAVKCTELVREMTEDPFDRLSFPTVSNFYWSILSAKPKLIGIYIKFLADMFKDLENIDTAMWIAYWMIIWGFLHARFTPTPQIVLRDIYHLVIQLEKRLHSLHPLPPKEAEQNYSQEPLDSGLQLQMFQRHCRTELIKLKNCVKLKLCVSSGTKKL